MKLGQTIDDIKAYGNKYHFYYHEDKKMVVCTTLYKGQMVRGIAKCDPDDEFDLEFGKRCAYLRCKVKFARKKLRHALKVGDEAFIVANRAKHNLDKAREFMVDSEMQLENAIEELNEFESQFNN